MTLHGIDVADHQAGMDISIANTDFVIVKATGGTAFKNDLLERQADMAVKSGKKLGIYHYAFEDGYTSGNVNEEAAHFLKYFAKYKGIAVPALDWENTALSKPVEWAKRWLEIVARETGATPLFYTGAGEANTRNADFNWKYADISNYPLWKASYLSRYDFQPPTLNPVDIWGNGPWDKATIYQYNSQGRVNGWYKNIDMNVFYGEREDWDRMCGKKAEQVPGNPVNNAGIKYQAHIQNVGWCPVVRDGQCAGTTGHSLRLEGLKIDPPEGWVIDVKEHIQNVGWKIYKGLKHGNEVVIGTTGKSLRLEYLEIDVVSRPKGDKRKLYFQVHQQNSGWKNWTEEGYASGCDGQSTRLEAVRIKIQ